MSIVRRTHIPHVSVPPDLTGIVHSFVAKRVRRSTPVLSPWNVATFHCWTAACECPLSITNPCKLVTDHVQGPTCGVTSFLKVLFMKKYGSSTTVIYFNNKQSAHSGL